MANPTDLTRKDVGFPGGLSPDTDLHGDMLTQLNNNTASVRLLATRGDTGDAAAVALANELKTDYTALLADYTAAVTLTNELKTDYTALLADYTAAVTLANELKTDYTALLADYTAAVTLANEQKTDFNALHADVTAIRTSVTGITAKLDLDAGVTDTNYAATQNPAAMTATTVAAANAAVTATAIAAANAAVTATAIAAANAAVTATAIAAASLSAQAYATNITDSAIATAPTTVLVSVGL